MAKFFIYEFCFDMQISRITTNLPQRPSFQGKIEWIKESANDNKICFEPFVIEKGVFDDLFVTVKKYGDDLNRWKIEVRDRFDEFIGHDVLGINEETNNMYDYTMTVKPKYRQTGNRFGELLRCFGVVQMLENNAPELRLCSSSEAVYFHSKYKFEARVHGMAERDNALKTIANDKDWAFLDLSMKAKKMIKFINTSNIDVETSSKTYEEVDKLVNKYIQRALKREKHPEEKHGFDYNLSMVLTREKVLKNKEFFNRLFKRQDIEYLIK